MKFHFGKYKNEEVCDVPLHYLRWIEEQDWITKFPELNAEIKHEIERQTGDRPGKGFVKPKINVKI
jgi:uncharacterized protein (DUF3820 family)